MEITLAVSFLPCNLTLLYPSTNSSYEKSVHMYPLIILESLVMRLRAVALKPGL
jgi:hypothetical protein